MPLLHMEDSVAVLSGVGPARQKLLSQLHIETLRDLLFHLPRGYQNRRAVRRLCEAQDGAVASFLLTVATPVKTVMLKRRLTLSRARAFDESASCILTYFGQPYLKDMLEVGKEYRFYGKVKRKGNQIELLSPIFEEVRDDLPLPDLVAVYPLTRGLSSKVLSALIRQALGACDIASFDALPYELADAQALPSLEQALWELHFPSSQEALERAQRRMVFCELFLFSLCIASQSRKKTSGLARDLSPEKEELNAFLSSLPYTPTNAQLRAIGEISADLCAPAGVPMSRLLNGDVGSGKTLCAAAAAYFALCRHTQCAIMAPTEILATQHYQSLAPLFEKLGFRCVLLHASLKASEKNAVLSAIASGDADLIIGTHAILSEKVTFFDLGLVITDEQHRFGIFQRTALAEKGRDPHLLVMSATPIPRTLALILYGDLALSTLDELPPGRQSVDTFRVDESYRQRLQSFILKLTEQGQQVYIVCPSIEEAVDSPEEQMDLAFGNTSASSKMKNVTEYAKDLKRALPQLEIEVMHGKLSPAKKEEVMRRFVAGQVQVLVSTTVIEVGVNVPNATLMIVENAERFGLSQLHQLRGRVGRGAQKSYCILVSDAKEETANARLQALCDCRDGYEIAKRDLALRGPGDFFPHTEKGTARQSGQPLFRFASLCDDLTLLQTACDCANRILEEDASLSHYPNTKQELLRLQLQQRNTVH